MHVPDGFLTNPVCAATTVLAAAGLAGAAYAAHRGALPGRAKLAAVVGAGIFAGQMVNFPIANGTSGHLVGAALATVLLGFGPGLLVMATVLTIQCLVFGDGGIWTLGANVLNMAVVGATVSAAVLMATRSRLPQLLAVALAAWCSVMAAAGVCACEMAASGLQPLGTVLPAMLKVHAVIGLGEAALSVLVMAMIGSLSSLNSVFKRQPIAAGLSVALLTAIMLAPLASSAPDGLEWIADSLGFENAAMQTFNAPLSDYTLPGWGASWASTALAGVCGTLLVFAAIGSYRRLLEVLGEHKPGTLSSIR